MDQLTTTEKQILEKMPEGLRHFATAKQEPSFNKRTLNEQKSFCLNTITKAYAFAGIKDGENDQTLIFQTQFLLDELKGKFSILTFSEITKAFEMGLRNEFGQYFGINPKTYYQFLHGFIEHPLRKESHREFIKMIEDAAFKRTEKPLQVKLLESKESVLNAFEDFKKSKTIPMAPAAHYIFLFENKIVEWSLEERSAIIAETSEQYISELKKSMRLGHITKDGYDKIVNHLDSGKNATFVRKIRTKSLILFFEKLVKEKIELKDLFDAKGI